MTTEFDGVANGILDYFFCGADEEVYKGMKKNAFAFFMVDHTIELLNSDQMWRKKISIVLVLKVY